MKFLQSQKFLIFLIVFVNFLGYGIVFPILPLLTLRYGGDPLISGLIIAAFSIMQVISMPIFGHLSDKYGRRPLLIISLWGTVISFLIMGLTHSLFWLFIARMIDGASGGNISIAQAYVADITDKKHRAGGMGIIAAGISLGFIFGPLWGGFFSNINLTAPFFAAALVTAISAVLTHFFLPESLSKKEFTYEKKHFRLFNIAGSSKNLLLFCLYIINFFLFWSQSGIQTTLSLFGNDILHITVVQISLLFAFGGVISVIIQAFLIGKIVRIIPEKTLFIISTVIMTLGFFLFSQAHSILILFIAMTLYYFANGFFVPILQSLVSESAPPHEQGGSLGIFQSYGSIGRIFGPISAGFIYEKISPFAPSVMGTIIFAVVLLLNLLMLKSQKSIT